MANLAAFDLTGKKALITGGGRGIGKSIALTFARAGADIMTCARTFSEVERTVEEIRALGVKGAAIKADVRVPEDVQNLIKETISQMGGIDILVNNAGGTFRAEFMDLSLGGWEAILKENLSSTFLCSKEAGKVMLQAKKGNIVNIASIAGMDSDMSNTACYGAAKAGVVNLTKTLATLWAPHNIRVNAIAAGYIETEGAKAIKRPPEDLVDRMRFIPMRRWGRPEEVANSCVFLASDASSYITGVTLLVGGGLSGHVLMSRLLDPIPGA